jgi:hypothetical protein
MAGVVLISTLGFTINIHFCHDQIVDLALYSPAESCCDTGNDLHCHSDDGIMPMDHCEDDSIVVEALEGFVVSSFVINLDNNHSIDILSGIAFQHSIPYFIETSKSNAGEYYTPLLFREVNLSQIQFFLI